jgi:hypothetical protein
MLRCAGRIADPLVEVVLPAASGALSGGGGLLGGLARWSDDLRTKRANESALYALGSKWLKGEGWTPAAFGQSAAADYTAVFAAVSGGAWGKVKPLVTEQLLPLLRKGAAESAAATGARQGALVLQHVAPPAIVQARLISSRPTAALDPSARPDFAQLTVRHETVQQPVAWRVAAAARSSRESGYTSEGEAETAGATAGAAMTESAAQADLGEWVAVRHGGSGAVYWYNTASGVSTWTAPRPSQHVPRNPIRLESIGLARTPLPKGALAHLTDGGRGGGGGGEAGGQLMRVVHHVVWERCLMSEAATAWRCDGEGRGGGGGCAAPLPPPLSDHACRVAKM